MPLPRAVVIPFGVPSEGRGLGLGLAALVHTFVHFEGGGVALAQLHGRGGPSGDTTPRFPVEAFVPPEAWRDISGRGDSPTAVGLVLTGSFEPPVEGAGAIQLLAFDARDGRTRAHVDAPVDAADAGAVLVATLERFGASLGVEIGALAGLRELGWDSLESVLRAERCALHDPARGGPHDRLAAMLHLGRAISEAPGARYPAERLAAIALDAAAGPVLDARLAAAAVRALERSAADAPEHPELVETLVALHLRLGRARDAELRLNALIATTPRRPRPYALLSQALRAQGNLDGALAALHAGILLAPGDPLLLAERGIVHAARGDLQAAQVAWQLALARDAVHPVAFESLSALALRQRDAASAQSLVDSALAEPRSPPDVLRRAVQLALGTEADGLARASRIARLCERILERAPTDAHAAVALARAELVLGEKAKARARLAQVAASGSGSSAAAEAQTTQLAIDDPHAELEIRSVLRAAHIAPAASLADVGTRARRLATLHNSWSGWLAAAVAERRRGRWMAARGALEVALETAPGAAVVHIELSGILLALGDAPAALTHGRSAISFEGDTPRALVAVARALVALGRRAEADDALNRALAQRPDDADAAAVRCELRGPVRLDAAGRRDELLRWALAVWRRFVGR